MKIVEHDVLVVETHQHSRERAFGLVLEHRATDVKRHGDLAVGR
jgi:hypothetical protein